ncbi:ferritin-like domain-containing protein [Rhodoferax aquaticus]|uniref:Ferritin-like domain-containing protein n=1 Tax=Rhodoferax aquaticus TaxID=2527691 RepID=A0A515EMM3_9BURK|nr:ferritin-like domain-containing protein [Rhodoferax aquaticus]QDL53899.1 ferritin-like domain-containing protein [Rhodoferax aquaticus]
MQLRHSAYHAFGMQDPIEKALATQAMWDSRATLAIESLTQFPRLDLPGLPDTPRIVPPQDVPKRSPFTPLGHASLIHSIAHIEFNAINLALDAVWRFTGMPDAFYVDWAGVAQEEAKHFLLLRAHLQTLGYDYGDFDAHDGLWTICRSTQDDIIARMALVPRTLEARGLDATPLVQNKLRKVGTPSALEAVAILDLILKEEVGHVAIGNRWYAWLCQRDGHDPLEFHRQAVIAHRAPRPKPPHNLEARQQAGFTAAELQALTA